MNKNDQDDQVSKITNYELIIELKKRIEQQKLFWKVQIAYNPINEPLEVIAFFFDPETEYQLEIKNEEFEKPQRNKEASAELLMKLIMDLENHGYQVIKKTDKNQSRK